MAAKKHYFGVGGGSRRFLSLVEKDGELSFIPMIFLVCLTSFLFLCSVPVKGYSFEHFYK